MTVFNIEFFVNFFSIRSNIDGSIRQNTIHIQDE